MDFRHGGPRETDDVVLGLACFRTMSLPRPRRRSVLSYLQTALQSHLSDCMPANRPVVYGTCAVDQCSALVSKSPTGGGGECRVQQQMLASGPIGRHKTKVVKQKAVEYVQCRVR